MAAEYIVLADLDKVYSEDSHPKLFQIEKYLEQTNRILSIHLQTETFTDVYGGLKEVGLMLMENKIHNRKVKDRLEGYEDQQLLPEILTLDMIDLIAQEKQLGNESFSFNPGSNNANFT